MKKIGLLSDTHGFIHPRVFDFFSDCDEIWHAGDIGNIGVCDKINAYKPLKAVYGNIDGHELRKIYPVIQHFTCENLKVMITHIAGYPGKYAKGISQILKEAKPDLLIAGHSHILKVIPDQRNRLLFINPGAAGIQGFHSSITFVRFCISGNQMHDLEVMDINRASLSDSVNRP